VSRCQHTGFYVAGFKVADKEAYALTPTGRLRVTTRTAKAGEINIHELVHGTPLEVARVGLFAFDKQHYQGRAGRHIDLKEQLERLPLRNKHLWLRRIATSRSDLEALTLVLDSSSYRAVSLQQKHLATMLARCSAHWGELPRLARRNNETAMNLAMGLEGVTDAAILFELASADDIHDMCVNVAHRRLGALNRHDLSTQIARKRLIAIAQQPAPTGWPSMAFEFAAALETLDIDELVSLADEYFTPDVSIGVVETLAEAIIDGSSDPNLVPARVHRLLTLLDRFQAPFANDSLERVVKHKREAANAAVKVAMDRQERLRTAQEREDRLNATTAEMISTLTGLDGEELIEEMFFAPPNRTKDRDTVLYELARRNTVDVRLLQNDRYRWIKALHDTHMFDKDAIIANNYTSAQRIAAMPHLRTSMQLKVAKDPTEFIAVRAAALTALDDIELWEEHALNLEPVLARRFLLDITPLEVLTALAERNATPRRQDQDLWEVAVWRGAISPSDAMASPYWQARRAAMAKTQDQTLVTLALNDPDPLVQIAAVGRSRDYDAIRALQSTLDPSTFSPSNLSHSHSPLPLTAPALARLDAVAGLHQACANRAAQLTQHTLVVISVAKGELGVARAALETLRHRDLLTELTSEPALMPHLALRLEAVQRRGYRNTK
jgi:hypothetical protein